MCCSSLGSLLTNLREISSWSLIEGYSWGTPGDQQEEDVLSPNGTEKGAQKAGVGTSSFPSSSLQHEQRVETVCEGEDDVDAGQNFVVIEDLYTKRQCTDANRMIEETFAALTNSSIK